MGWRTAPKRSLVLSRTKREAKTDVPGLAARRAAHRALAEVLDRGAMLSEAGDQLSPAIRAEARGLADTVLRRLGQIDAVIGRFVERRPPPPAHHALRLLTAEVLFAGTPSHAAVDLAVHLVRESPKGARLTGLTNAVGRRIAREGPEIAADQDAAALNTPRWLAERFRRDWGKSAARRIAQAHLTPAPHDLTVRTAADTRVLARELGATILPTDTLRLSGRPQLSALPGYASGAWWVQDAAAALPARLIPIHQSQRVLDVCAAPGGKTLQLAASGMQVTALDISTRRMALLDENLARTDLSAGTITADALNWTPDTPFDAILLDAPCSASGTLRRHPDLAHRLTGAQLETLLELQVRLLDRAFEWLRPGGTLVYAVCSLFKAEGEDQCDAFLARTAKAELETAPTTLPPEFIDAAGRLRTRPDMWAEQGGLDGFFAARIKRVG